MRLEQKGVEEAPSSLIFIFIGEGQFGGTPLGNLKHEPQDVAGE
jgi:hypothetical protein